MNHSVDRSEVATFGGGCFWCTEAVFENLDGVLVVTSGYAGGHTANPGYRDVCSGTTGHAEVVQVRFDPQKISFEALLSWFFRSHDPTTLNRQGADTGTQYRSVIFYHDDAQRRVAEKVKTDLDQSGTFPSPIVTEISPLETFFAAEDYHQGYFRRNPHASYCSFVIRPKLSKLNLNSQS